MLIAVSGSQGSGKTTILNKISNQTFYNPKTNSYHKINIVERKTSRSILSDWGVTLEQVNNNPDLTIKFQEEIILRKFNDEKHCHDDSELWFTERTFADLFTYALISLGKDNKYTEWLNQYYKKCIEYQQYYSYVYYLKAGFFNVERDGVRGEGKHYSRMVDLVMLDYTEQMTMNHKLNIIQTPDIDERISIILQQSKFQWLTQT